MNCLIWLCFLLLVTSSNAFSTLSPVALTSTQRNRLETTKIQYTTAAFDPLRQRVHFSSATTATTGPERKSASNSFNKIGKSSMGLIKAIVGAGVLSLPSGLAATSDAPSSLFRFGNPVLVVLGMLSGYTFWLYGRLTHATGATSLGGLWSSIFADNDSSDRSNKPSVVSMVNFCFCFGVCLTMLLVIGDAVSGLLTSSEWWASRHSAILATTATCLYPFCSMPSLDALAPLSFLGVVGSLLSTAFLAWRCPSVNLASPYPKPTMNTYTRSPASRLVLLSMACVAYMAHVAAPDFYHSFMGSAAAETEKKSNTSNTPKATGKPTMGQFGIMAAISYAIVTVLNIVTLSCGFLTFGGQSEGVILNNYAPTDMGARLSRFLVALSVMGAFPFLLAACRSEALAIFDRNHESSSNPSGRQRRMTNLLIAVLTSLSLLIKDTGFVVSFNGALTGTAIIYVIPAMMFLKLSSKVSASPSQWLSLERWFCRGLIAFGGISSLLGAATTLALEFFPSLIK